MDTSIRTSFIPKESLSKATEPKHGGKGVGFFTFLCMTVLVISLLGWGAAYSYQSLTAKDVASLEGSLEKAKEAFEPSLLKIFENLDRRLRVSNILLSSHTAVDSIFKILSDETLKSVRYKAFSYASNASGIAVKMDGEAENFEAIALQALAMSKNDKIVNPIFSGLGVGSNGRINFIVTFSVNPSSILYMPQNGSKLQGL